MTADGVPADAGIGAGAPPARAPAVSTAGRRALRAILVLVALFALALPAWVVMHPPAMPRTARPIRPVAVVPPDVVPPVEPVQYQALSPDDAVSYNASIPFSDAPNPPARPFTFYGGSDDLARARDCLAAAAWYEAGDDAIGEQAVVQVVLNRVRHPAFPHTVCGAVFQGAERRTGCQFTFTCDGALTRTPSPAAWDRARDIAAAALAGKVFKPVGTATHYHTDWVVPYWSSSLDKIAEIHTHLFFRWTGWWGTPGAFRNHQAGGEPVIAKLALLSPLHRAGGMAGAGDAALADAALTGGGTATRAAPGDPDTFLAKIDDGATPDSYRTLALATCGARVRCKFMAWTDARLIPATATLTPQQMGTMAFSYLRDKDAGFEKPLWNCRLFPTVAPASCMRRQLTLSAMPVVPAAARPVIPAGGATAGGAPSVVELNGVRRRGEPAPAAPPSAAPTPQPRPSPTATAATPGSAGRERP